MQLQIIILNELSQSQTNVSCFLGLADPRLYKSPRNQTCISDLKVEVRLFRRTKGPNRRGKGEEGRVGVQRDMLIKTLCAYVGTCNPVLGATNIHQVKELLALRHLCSSYCVKLPGCCEEDRPVSWETDIKQLVTGVLTTGCHGSVSYKKRKGFRRSHV